MKEYLEKFESRIGDDTKDEETKEIMRNLGAFKFLQIFFHSFLGRHFHVVQHSVKSHGSLSSSSSGAISAAFSHARTSKWALCRAENYAKLGSVGSTGYQQGFPRIGRGRANAGAPIYMHRYLMKARKARGRENNILSVFLCHKI